MRPLPVLALAALALTGCAGGPPPAISQDAAERALSRVNRVAQPGDVVAADIRFARAAREDGQWTAFKAYAGPDAMIHGRNGPILAAPWLAEQTDPAQSVQWTPTAVWLSCTGDTAVSVGTFRDAEAMWGQYVTVWQQQRDGSYKWIYDMGATDPFLTERRNRELGAEPLEEGAIVVEAFDDVRADVATCTDPSAMPAPRPFQLATGSERGQTLSRDRSLVWRWVQEADGARSLVVEIVKGRDWEQALSFRVTPEGTIVR